MTGIMLLLSLLLTSLLLLQTYNITCLARTQPICIQAHKRHPPTPPTRVPYPLLQPTTTYQDLHISKGPPKGPLTHRAAITQAPRGTNGPKRFLFEVYKGCQSPMAVTTPPPLNPRPPGRRTQPTKGGHQRHTKHIEGKTFTRKGKE